MGSKHRMKMSSLCGTLLVVTLVTPGRAAVSLGPVAGGSAQPYLHVSDSFAIEVPDRQRVYHIGDRLPLFQKNQRYFIARIEDTFEGAMLCAFPRINGDGQGTAWVTKEKQLIFGVRTHSCNGKFYFKKSEDLRLLDETDDAYVLAVERHGRTVSLRVPKPSKKLSLIYKHPPKPATTAAAPRPESRRAQPTRSRTRIAPRVPLITHEGMVEPFDTPPVVPERRLTGERKRIVYRGGEASSMVNITIKKPEGDAPPTPAAEVREQASVADETPSEPAKRAPGQEEEAAELQQTKTEMLATETEPALEIMWSSVGTEDEAPVDDPTRVETERAAPAAGGRDLANERKTEASGLRAIIADNEQRLVETASDGETSLEPDVPPKGLVVAGDDGPSERAAADDRSATAGRRGTSVVDFLARHHLVFVALLVVVLIEGVLILRLRWRGGRKSEDATGYETYESVGESIQTSVFQDIEREGIFTGSLDGFSLGELIQFLHSAKETGALLIRSDHESPPRRLYFQDGDIVGAQNGEVAGEEAVRDILRSQQGTFTFQRESPPTPDVAIRRSTMSMLLEAHKLLDEEATSEQRVAS